MSGGRRRRPLTDEEKALWEAVARTTSPLGAKRKARRKPAAAKPDIEPPSPPQPPQPAPRPAAKAATKPAGTPPAPAVRRPAAPEAFDRRTTSRVARGTIVLDGRLDLHGFTQEEAYRRLLVFVGEIQARGGRMVLVITGKGGDGARMERGVLRRVVPQWLGSAPFRPFVSAYDDAHRLHGGGGALYVRIRKA